MAQGTTSPDSAVTVRGVLEIVEDSDDRPVGAILFLEQQLALPGGAAQALTLGGDLRRLGASDSHFVQVTGRLGPPQAAVAGQPPLPTLQVGRVREAQPVGLVRRNISGNMNELVVAALAVVPNRVARQDSAQGRRGEHARWAGGALALVLFAITDLGREQVPTGNLSDGGVQIALPTTDIVCVSVTPQGTSTPTWKYVWKATDASTTLRIRVGTTFRSLVPLPREAAPAAGQYTVRATLCGLDEYVVEAPLDVQG